MAKETHATLSPSSSERWIACPGSIAAQAAVTEPDEGGKASREGTVAHSLLQVCLLFGFKPQEFLGAVIDKNMPPVVQHMIDGVQCALDYVEEYLDFHGADKVEVLTERRVYVGKMIGVPDEVCNGTSDLTLRHLDGSCLNVCDYKHGLRVVEAADNPQLMLYTAGVIAEHGKHKSYRNTIIQPRAPKKRPVEEVDYKHGKLTIFLRDVSRSAQAALLPNAPRVAGEHCTFCRASSNCQTYRRRVRQVAADEFGEIEDPESIPDEDINDVLREAVLLKNWISQIEARALRMATAGVQLVDYQLGWSARKRIFQDPELVADWCKKHKLLVDEYMPRALLTPKKLEDVLKRRKLYPVKKRGDTEAPESPISHLVGYTTPKPALKPRAGNSAVEDFAEDDE